MKFGLIFVISFKLNGGMKRRDNRVNYNTSRLENALGNDYFTVGNVLRGYDRTVVYVEGYDDIAFWRKIFDRVKGKKFKVMTPVRADLAKGKKVVLSFCDRVGENLYLCVDSDFDYLLGLSSEQSSRVNNCKYLVQTFAYAIENLQCDPRTLQSVAVSVTNSDEIVFEFESFFQRYSEIIYPLFLWYYWSAASNRVDVFPLAEFKEAARINFLEFGENGDKTLEWLKRKVEKTLNSLQKRNPAFIDRVAKIEPYIYEKGVDKNNVHFFMQGHTLLDDVVKPIMARVCERMRFVMQTQIENSFAKNISKRNQLSGYNNSLADIDTVLRENVGYMEFEFYDKIKNRIDEIMNQS